MRRELGRADVVVAKLDAPNEELIRQINRPKVSYTLDEIIEAIRLFRGEYQGKLALQMMFVDANRSYAPQMARLAEKLSPDEVQLNTPLRPCAVNPLTPEEITAIRHEFSGLKGVVTVYEALRPKDTPLNPKETLRRRPRL